MIRYKKTVRYIEKNRPDRIYEIEKKPFYTIGEALEYLNNAEIKSYLNNKAITVIEQAEVIETRNTYGDNPAYKRYYKTINEETGEEIGNIKDL